MKLYERLIKQNLSKYELAKRAQIPYTTLNDLFNEKTELSKSSAALVYRLAKALDVSMETLLTESSIHPVRSDFESFKSTLRHLIHDEGDLAFLERVITEDWIHRYAQQEWFAETLYTLAMVDYLCRIHALPLVKEYESLRNMRLSRPIYPASLTVMSLSERRKAFDAAIPEFKRVNIVENEIRHVA
jgi:transcriptional regulator with XRE-family HTH domain